MFKLGRSSRIISIYMLLILLIIDVIWLPFSNLYFDVASIVTLCGFFTVFIFLRLLHQYIQFSEIIMNLVENIFILLIFSFVGFVFSYLVTASGGALQDERIVAVDSLLGFNWQKYTIFFLQSDLLRGTALLLYVLTPFLVVFTIVWLSINQKIECSRAFVAMIMLGGILCIIISGLIPSGGGAGYFSPDINFYRGYSIFGDPSYKQTFFDLRNGLGMKVSFIEPKGLVAFPSYHACMATLILIHFWNINKVFWVMFLLNTGALLVIPFEGGHHLSDVLSGSLLAIFVYMVVKYLTLCNITQED